MLDLFVHFSVLIVPIAGTAGLIVAAARHVDRNRVCRDRALACDAGQLLALLDAQEQHYAEKFAQENPACAELPNNDAEIARLKTRLGIAQRET